jgi:CRISPR-associated protein Cas2
MVYWVIYDISKNKGRSKVAKICKNYGLTRVQKSAFLGELTRNKAEMLAIEIEKFVEKSTDKVFVIPAGKEEFAKKIVFGEIGEMIVEKPEVIFIE